MKTISKMNILSVILLLIACTSATLKSQVGFKDKVETFLTSMSNDYSRQQSNSKFTWALDKQKNHTWVKKVSLIGESENVVIDIFFYEYQDSTSLKKAYESLLSCFPTDCMELSEGQERKAFKTTPSLVIVSSTSIVIANTECTNQSSRMWSNVKTDVYKEFSTESAKVITTDCGGNLKWSWQN